MLAAPLNGTVLPEQAKHVDAQWDVPADMDCDDAKAIANNLNSQRPSLSSYFGMVPSLSSSSIASSASNATNEYEPELSQSIGSSASFDVRTPLRVTQPLVQNKHDEAADLRASFQNYTMAFGRTLTSPKSAIQSTNLDQLVENTKANAPSPGVMSHAHLPCTPGKSPEKMQQHQSIFPTKSFTKCPISKSENTSPVKALSHRPKLSLSSLGPSAFSRPNMPQTPGGSLFFGARDGAANGPPISPFLPPTPLVASNMLDSNDLPPSSFFEATSTDHVGMFTSTSQNRQSLPFATVSTPRQNKITRSPLQKHGSIGMSPLSLEFACVSVRGKTQSNDNISNGSPMARKLPSSTKDAKNTVISPKSCSSPSTLLTPPYSPLILGKSLQDDSVVAQRRTSSSSSNSITNLSISKKRAKDALLGGNADLARSFSASRLKSSRTKAAPQPFNFNKTLFESSGPPKQPVSAPAMRISFSEQTLPSSQLANDTVKSEAAVGSNLSLGSASLLSPSDALSQAVLKAPTMEKSFSAPIPPQTVSAQYLSNYNLHPIFSRSYTLGDELGSGGFGFVVAATRNVDGMPVAVKFIWKIKVPSHGWVRDPKYGVIPMEAFVLKVVDHPGVVKFVDLFDDHQFFYLVMELHGTPWKQPNAPPEPKLPQHPGPVAMQRRTSCDLFECIEQHSRLSEEQARWVFAQVVDTVWHLDQVGICHRDIKDENCVVDADFNVKLIDFGSAVITDVRKPQPYFNRFFGTMTFASPEILMGKPYRAPQAEVWSLGVLLSILLSGQCPFPDPASAIKGKISKPKGAWSPEALGLLFMCLEVNPDKRVNISQIRNHPWVSRAWKDRADKADAAQAFAQTFAQNARN